MHIPDGYLSPQTDAVLGAGSAIMAAIAAYRTSKTVRAKYIPLISIGAAFSFTIMMFNVPVPDGTTAHAVGGAMLAVLLGPWAAMIGVSVALIIQALFFGDGGLLALGANVFNMAFILPFVSYYIYKLISGSSTPRSKRRWIAAAIGGYLGLTVSALFAGIEFGLQPILFNVNGIPLYSPYGLNVAVPAMLLAHMTVAGPLEGLITALVVIYIQRTNPYLLEFTGVKEESTGYSIKRLVMGLIVLALLTPLGLLSSGTAWGEWGKETIKSHFGFVPSGFNQLNGFWNHALLQGYGFSGQGISFWQNALVYLLSAFTGLIAIGMLAFLFQRYYRKGGR